jgi:hypothetical protein
VDTIAAALREEVENLIGYRDGGDALVSAGRIWDYARMLVEQKIEDAKCPHDFSHTRHWCGYAECRES